MPAKDELLHPPLAETGAFHTTHWSVVLAARGASDSQTSTALESLCRTYWKRQIIHRKKHSVAKPQPTELLLLGPMVA